MAVTEDDREDGREPGASSAPSQSGVKPQSGPEAGKAVVNAIPLPPRKPTNHSQSVSPAVDHRSVFSEDKGAGGSWGTSGHSSNTLQSPAEHSGHSQEHGLEGRPRRVSEDRPKLDKSHSTPAYDMDGDVGQEGLSAPLAPVKAVSPSRLHAAAAPAATQVMLGESKVKKHFSSKKYIIFSIFCSVENSRFYCCITALSFIWRTKSCFKDEDTTCWLVIEMLTKGTTCLFLCSKFDS